MCLTWYESEATLRGAAAGSRPRRNGSTRLAGRRRRSIQGATWHDAKANVVDSLGPNRVGSYPTGASWVGALDTAGRAMEWVADWPDADYYKTSPATDPTGPTTGEIKVEKGGWWGSNEFVARSAYRHYEDPPTYGDHHIGFRVASQ